MHLDDCIAGVAGKVKAHALGSVHMKFPHFRGELYGVDSQAFPLCEGSLIAGVALSIIGIDS